MDDTKEYIDRNIIFNETQRLMAEYNDKHCRCPECGSNRNTQTLMGHTLDPDKPEEFKDTNLVSCHDCEWSGIVHDLVGKEQ